MTSAQLLRQRDLDLLASEQPPAPLALRPGARVLFAPHWFAGDYPRTGRLLRPVEGSWGKEGGPAGPLWQVAIEQFNPDLGRHGEVVRSADVAKAGRPYLTAVEPAEDATAEERAEFEGLWAKARAEQCAGWFPNSPSGRAAAQRFVAEGSQPR